MNVFKPGQVAHQLAPADVLHEAVGAAVLLTLVEVELASYFFECGVVHLALRNTLLAQRTLGFKRARVIGSVHPQEFARSFIMFGRG